MPRIFRSKPLTSPADAQRRPTPSAWSAPVTLLIAPGALLATIAFSCHDRDAIWIAPPGGGGAAGDAPGVAGTGGGGGGGGMGGANAAGAAGSSSGGTAGSAAGAAGSGNGGSAGSGTAGTTGLPGDAGPDSGEPDSGGPQPLPTATTQAEAVSNICVLMDRVPSCQAPADPCIANVSGGWDAVKGGFPPACGADIDAYFFCAANAADANYDCSSGDSTPEITTGQTGSCADEEATYFAIFDNSNPCNPP